MIAEIDIDGVLFSSMLVAVPLAVVATYALHRLLAWAGAYRFIWHSALFDAASFVIFWALITKLPLSSVP
jgi:hypothetical protein